MGEQLNLKKGIARQGLLSALLFPMQGSNRYEANMTTLNRKEIEYLPGFFNGLAGIGVIVLSFLTKLCLPISSNVSRPLGFFLVFTGILLVIWATFYIKRAILGEIQPKLGILIQSGPYQIIRHPVYLGMTIALLGVPISLRSWPGIIGVFLLFLPSEIYRAKREEKELSKKFGNQWENYIKRTGFILPIARGK